MAIKIPESYDYRILEFDPLEMSVRDDFNVDIENWAKFRHTITASVNSNSLVSRSPINTNVKSSYVELSKTHYEVVTMLGAVKMSLIALEEYAGKNDLIFKKSFKEFYMHAGSVLDNLSRLIYIVNMPNSANEVDRYGRFKRHSIGYGQLSKLYLANKANLKGYGNISRHRVMHEIKNVRNNFTHSWSPVMFIDSTTGNYLWPIAMRKKEQYYLWPHDNEEIRRIKREYRKKLPVIDLVKNDWLELEQFQNMVFKRLYMDIKKFERNYNLKIT
ncbi:hypothetical protein ACFGVR_13670 [Mucilaginibacter sp. AW1-3]